MTELFMKILALAVVCFIWGFLFSWAADRDEKEFQESLKEPTP